MEQHTHQAAGSRRSPSARRALQWACLIAAVAACQAEVDRVTLLELPHVNDCSMCMKCHVTEKLPPPIPSQDIHKIDGSYFHPTPEEIQEKQKKPFCEECHGCNVELQLLSSHGQKFIFNRTFSDEAGASPNWLFRANTTESPTGKAIIKVACVPVGKVPGQGPTLCVPPSTSKHAHLYLALEKLSVDCGFTEIVPKVWVQRISAILPGYGYHITWHATWMVQAPGISLENLVRLGTPALNPNDMLDFLHNKLNKTQVILATIYDLITSQCDRHAQNIFMDDDGQLTLIDNERCLFDNNWCGIDSILLPTTKKFAINVFENAWVNKFKDWGSRVPQAWANPPLLLDYRCYVKDGKLGKAWPPKVAQCLSKLNSMTKEDIQLQYGMPDLVTSEALKNRTKVMWESGFEEALTHGWPRNPNPWRYKFAEPCCKIVHLDTYRCGHPWHPDTALPLGDPIGGLPWKRDWKDLGTYEGGSVF